MSGAGRAVLGVGDRLQFDGRSWAVGGLQGVRVRLVDDAGDAQVLLLAHVLASPGFELLEAGPSPARLDPVGLIDALPATVLERARQWERHVVEVQTGLPPDAPAGVRPREPYDPARHTLAQREAVKAAELTEAGQPTSAVTVKRMRLRYRSEGLWGLVDHRATRPVSSYGRVDDRVVAAVEAVMVTETGESTGTRSRLRHRVEQLLAVEHGPGVVPMPSTATFYRLAAVMDAGRHTFGEATTRRSLANRPARPFTRAVAVRPGELVQVDTSPLDVMALLDDGVTGRVELSVVLDVATRSICAAVLRPQGTKAVDAALLLAKMLVPEPMRPGWADALAMARSRIPHRRLLDLDARLEHAAARPVIVPETIITDRGAVFVSETFVRACARLGISVEPARPGTPTDKGHVERTFGSIRTLFCQHVAGYVGPNVTRRGTAAATEAVWSLPQLQELLDEWIVAGWQPRPHEGLRDPDAGGRVLSPNEMFAAAIAAAGYVTLPLTGTDYLELLPVEWRTIGDHGIQIDYRHYHSPDLGRYRHGSSGVVGKGKQWEVHYDPYDLSHVFVRDHQCGGWITATWTHLPMVGQPFADFTWRAARQIVAARGGDDTDETAVARALDDLLTRAGAGPGGDARHQRVAARTRAAARPIPSTPPADPEEPADAEEEGQDLPLAKVIPFGVFEPGDERRYR
ncbi:Mu transposase, C-terminal [Micromonospora echinofusca]|uniref:Mu transposase, C-terminal n=1 Tax=Micromonospora echinofusca TaxID=47858 RepID=A0A1C5GCK3_MICEH|nr:Mu transposase, C-terminal [Micromonospora echinofusca]